MYGIPIINRSLSIEVKLTSIAVGQTFQFPDNQIIRAQNVTVYGIEAFNNFQCAKTPSSLDVIPVNATNSILVTLCDDKSVSRIHEIPLFTFVSYYNGGMIREFAPFKCILSKSYIKIIDTANLIKDQAVLFNLLYKVN